MNSRVLTYVASIAILAVASTAGLFEYGPNVDWHLVAGPAAFALMGVVAQALTFNMSTGSVGSISFLPFLTGVILYPSWVSTVLVGLAALIGEIRQPKPNIKRVFNVAQYSLSASIATWCYVGFGGVSLQLNASPNVIAHIAAVSSFMLANSALVAIVLGIHKQRNIYEVWRQNTRGTLAYDAVAIVAVFLCALLFIRMQWYGYTLVFIVMTGARQFYSQTRALETSYEDALKLLVGAVELRDPYTSGHSQRVRKYSQIIAQSLSLPTKDVERIGVAALLHDVGKIDGIFVPILQKPGKLTSEERAIMELHPIKSAELVSQASQLADIVPTVRHHHENWDGTGYPDRLAGKSIPLGSRIIMFADTIDAMTTDRPYRKALGEAEVRSELQKFRGIQFDPQICDILVNSPEFARIFDKNDSGKVQSLTQVFDRFRRRARTPAVA